MITNIQDIAKEAGVSPSTVSRSFTRPELVSNKTREKVLKIANELNFSLSRFAVALKSGKALRIALLISNHIRLWFSASVIEGLNQIFHRQGYDISIFQISSIDERREFFTTLPVLRNADAVIVVSFDVDEAEIQQLATIDVPIIGINSVLPSTCQGFSASVNIDDFQGARMAVRHLVSLGHRNIAYIRKTGGGSLRFSVDVRFHSFLDCCHEEGIEPHIISIEENEPRVADAVAQLTTLPSMPTAVVCQEDSIALPLMFLLQRSGFNIPNDISVIGYDDSFYAEDAKLTTIRQDPVAMAQTAANITLDLINGNEPEQRFVTFCPQLIMRASTTKPCTYAPSAES